MEFFNTGYGKKFFEKDMPDLVKAINRLAEAAEKQNSYIEQTMGLGESEDKE